MKTIREIKEELQAASGTEREKLLELYREDTRSGVVSLVKKYDREKELLEKEKQRIEDMKSMRTPTVTWAGSAASMKQDVAHWRDLLWQVR